MPTFERYEDQRARWIASHAGPFDTQRRRAERLARRVREVTRAQIGADLDPQAEKITDPWFLRTWRNHGGGVAVGVSVLALVLGVLSCVAVAVGVIAYRVAWRSVPRRVRTIPVGLLFAVGSAGAGTAALACYLLGADPLPTWLAVQPGLGLVGAGGYAVACGWLAVPGSARLAWPRPPRPLTSTGKGVVEAEDYALDPMPYPRALEPNRAEGVGGRSDSATDWLAELLRDDEEDHR